MSGLRLRSVALVLIGVSLWIGPAGPALSFAEKKLPSGPDPLVPASPNAPPAISRRTAPEQFRCERQFVKNGNVLNCDSYQSRDGEGLRPWLQDLPAATAELNLYQENRAAVRPMAYLGTAGFLLAVTGFFVGQALKEDRFNCTEANPDGTCKEGKLNVTQVQSGMGHAVRNVSIIGGGALFVGGIGYSWVSLRLNERHLERAIQLHNEARPNSPIELQVSTQFPF